MVGTTTLLDQPASQRAETVVAVRAVAEVPALLVQQTLVEAEERQALTAQRLVFLEQPEVPVSLSYES